MQFYERFEMLCSNKNESINAVAKRLGIPSGSVTAWKNGTEPRISSASKIADYFGVSTDYLLGKSLEQKGDDSISNDIKFALFGTTQIDDEVLDEVKRFAKYIKDKKERGTQHCLPTILFRFSVSE